jgi:uncharacterized protein (TIGR03435 family)
LSSTPVEKFFMKRFGLALLLALIAGGRIAAVGRTQTKPGFEVASIKRNTSVDRRSRVGADGTRNNIDRFVATNASLRMLVLYAYPQLRSEEVIGGPTWIDSDRFDVEARPEHSNDPISVDKIELMLQSLLMDRFQLKAHSETKDLSIYNLVVAKYPPKIKFSEDQTPPLPPTAASPDDQLQRGAATVAPEPQGLRLAGRAVPISTLVAMLQGPAQAERRIFDKTGLSGLFDFELQFNPAIENGSQVTTQVDTGFPSLFTSIQELGLKLESSKGPVEVLVIDSVSKPTEN